MALQKQPVAINFAQGVQTKSDPYQIPIGNFLNLKNSVFTKAGRLTKRNGYPNITSLPNTTQTTLTTLNDNLIATGSNLYAFSQDTNQWLNRGLIQPVQLSTLPLIRASTGQSAADVAIAPNGLALLTYLDTDTKYYYQVSDSVTGQIIVSRTQLPATAFDARVNIVGPYFIISFFIVNGGSNNLQYIAIPYATPAVPAPATTISTAVAAVPSYDAYFFNNMIYFAWSSTGTTVKVQTLSNSLALSLAYSDATVAATAVSVTVDEPNNIVFVSYTTATPNIHVLAFDITLTVLMANTTVTAAAATHLTSSAANRVVKLYTEETHTFTAPTVNANWIVYTPVTMPVSGVGTGTVGAQVIVKKNVGLASKPFRLNSVVYFLAVYGDTHNASAAVNSNESTYFLLDDAGNVYMRLAAANAGGYLQTEVLPSVILSNGEYNIPYQVTDFLTSVNKGTALPSGTPVNAIYTQTGINLAKFTLNTTTQYSSEIASALHLTGGQLWEYDGVRPVEHGFHIYPENIAITTATGSGLITADTYYYVFTYEWTDNAGNLHRSAPSIPVKQVTTTATSTNTIKVPYLTLTYKTTPNPARIVGYRWSVTQPVYYQFTSVTTPTVNDPTAAQATITDALANSSILGNTLLYTTGGVIEDIAAPASIASTLYKNRLFLVDAEDRNLLWYSKQVIEAVPVEMSDLLTIYVAPTSGAQGSTGPVTALSAMDDKLIIFKRDAIYYITGNGPDNTGSNNDFSDPIFITSSVGSTNPNSIVLMPNGIMFQSDKGIWLLGRDLQTNYLGAPVELYNNLTVLSSKTIPGTNEVRFVMEDNITLSYDYYYNQWSIHTNIKAISATLYQSAHTYLNSLGLVYQEAVGTYLDGASPVLMGLTTGWINLAGLQGYERFYFMHLLGTYYTPFKLNVQVAYDYESGPSQSVIVTPTNSYNAWGDEALWGGGQSWGGTPDGNVFEARVFPKRQKCEAFQITIDESYDASFSVPAGQGLSLSGLMLTVGAKKGFRTQRAGRSYG